MNPHTFYFLGEFTVRETSIMSAKQERGEDNVEFLVCWVAVAGGAD